MIGELPYSEIGCFVETAKTRLTSRTCILDLPEKTKQASRPEDNADRPSLPAFPSRRCPLHPNLPFFSSQDGDTVPSSLVSLTKPGLCASQPTL